MLRCFVIWPHLRAKWWLCQEIFRRNRRNRRKSSSRGAFSAVSMENFWWAKIRFRGKLCPKKVSWKFLITVVTETVGNKVYLFNSEHPYCSNRRPGFALTCWLCDRQSLLHERPTFALRHKLWKHRKSHESEKSPDIKVASSAYHYNITSTDNIDVAVFKSINVISVQRNKEPEMQKAKQKNSNQTHCPIYLGGQLCPPLETPYWSWYLCRCCLPWRSNGSRCARSYPWRSSSGWAMAPTTFPYWSVTPRTGPRSLGGGWVW